MKKTLCFLLALVMLLLIVACDGPEGSGAGSAKSGKYHWVLVDTKDYDFGEFVDSREKFEFTYTSNYGRCNYVLKMVYDGKTRQEGNVEYVHGEAYSASCKFSEPPKTIGVGETVTLDIALAEEENTLVGWYGIPSGYADFVRANQEFNASSTNDIRFMAGDLFYHELHSGKGISSDGGEISAKAPSGDKGDRIAVRLHFGMSGVSVGTDYIYELQKK